jgi:hypothetical protein
MAASRKNVGNSKRVEANELTRPAQESQSRPWSSITPAFAADLEQPYTASLNKLID